MDSVAVLLSILGPIAGVAGAVVAGVFAVRTRKIEHAAIERAEQARDERSRLLSEREYERNVVRLVEEPLLYAASDLQSRLYNILERRFLETYARADIERHRVNAREYTAFLFAQYFGWVEALRQSVLLRDMADKAQGNTAQNNTTTVSLTAKVRAIADVLRTDRLGPHLLIFAGEQHAIGELMLQWRDHDGRRMPVVTRYATFAREFRANEEFRKWFEAITDGLEHADEPDVRKRLALVQGHLVDIMDLLDSANKVYVKRSKVDASRAAAKVAP